MNLARTILFNKSADETESSQDRASWYTPGFSDGLGDRLLMFDNTSASSLELLRFKPEFGGDAAFEEALRSRVDQLANFNHPSIARVRAVEQLGEDEGLALVSNQTAGRRLSDATRDARGPTFAMELIRQLVPVLAALQEQGPDIAHGALSADRIIITPEGRLVIVEHVLGSALDSLQISATRARAELGLAVPAFGEVAKFDTGTDVIQLAFISLSLLLGRRLDPTGYPEKGMAMLEEYPWAPSSSSSTAPRLRQWLERALQLNGQSFSTAREAQDALSSFHAFRTHAEPRTGDRATAIEPPRAPASKLFEFPRPVDADGDVTAPAAPSSEVTTTAPEPVASPPTPQPVAAVAIAALANPAPPELEFSAEEDVAQVSVEASGETSATTASSPFAYEALIASGVPMESSSVKASADNPSAPIAPPLPSDEHDSSASPFTPGPAFLSETQTTHEPIVKPAKRKLATTLLYWAAGVLALAVVLEGGVILGLIRTRSGSNAQATTPTPSQASVTPPAGTTATPPPPEASTASAPGTGTIDPASSPAASLPAGTLTGHLDITSDPSGARVTVDGQPAGVTPLSMVTGPGQHKVLISDGKTSTNQMITVPGGETATLRVSLAPVGSLAGYLSINSPVDLQVREGGSLLGITSAEKLMMPAGHHDLEVASAQLEFKTTLSVDVAAGKVTTASVTVPKGSLSINALPWAYVLLDGQQLAGTTPFANVEVPLGTHEVIWRHPQLGERRQTVVVTAKTPVRLQIDLNK